MVEANNRGMAVEHLQGGLDDRVAELEARLRRIAVELKAAGVMDDIDTLPAATDYPQLDELTDRQRQILIRLLNAQRVSVIAAELYLSPSTVRNHLMTIFSKFGVHSQVELLAVLRRQRR
jgi:DNA-binding NarL/FixJ family response regulator